MKTQERFKSERHNIFTEEINKISLNSNDEKRMQSFDLIETYAYGTSKDLINEKQEIKRALSGLRQYLVNEIPLKMVKNAFYFTLKALFVLKIFKFLS